MPLMFLIHALLPLRFPLTTVTVLVPFPVTTFYAEVPANCPCLSVFLCVRAFLELQARILHYACDELVLGIEMWVEVEAVDSCCGTRQYMADELPQVCWVGSSHLLVLPVAVEVNVGVDKEKRDSGHYKVSEEAVTWSVSDDNNPQKEADDDDHTR